MAGHQKHAQISKCAMHTTWAYVTKSTTFKNQINLVSNHKPWNLKIKTQNPRESRPKNCHRESKESQGPRVVIGIQRRFKTSSLNDILTMPTTKQQMHKIVRSPKFKHCNKSYFPSKQLWLEYKEKTQCCRNLVQTF